MKTYLLVIAFALMVACGTPSESPEIAKRSTGDELPQPDYDSPATDVVVDIPDDEPIIIPCVADNACHEECKADPDCYYEPDCEHGVWYDEKADPQCLRCTWESIYDEMDMCDYDDSRIPRLDNEPTEITTGSLYYVYHYRCIWNAEHTDLIAYHEKYTIDENGNPDAFQGGYTSGGECAPPQE